MGSTEGNFARDGLRCSSCQPECRSFRRQSHWPALKSPSALLQPSCQLTDCALAYCFSRSLCCFIRLPIHPPPLVCLPGLSARPVRLATHFNQPTTRPAKLYVWFVCPSISPSRAPISLLALPARPLASSACPSRPPVSSACYFVLALPRVDSARTHVVRPSLLPIRPHVLARLPARSHWPTPLHARWLAHLLSPAYPLPLA